MKSYFVHVTLSPILQPEYYLILHPLLNPCHSHRSTRVHEISPLICQDRMTIVFLEILHIVSVDTEEVSSDRVDNKNN